MRRLFIIFLFILLVFSSASLLVKHIYAQSQLSPRAVLVATPTDGPMDTTFTFDASSSTNSNGEKQGLEYRFNFGLTGSGFTSWSKQSIRTYRFDSPGEKPIILEVRDGNGLTDSTRIIVEVFEQGHFDGYLYVTATSGNVGTQFEFKVKIATTVAIPQEDYVVRLDYDGDDKFETGFTKERIFHYAYAKPGYYLPTLLIKAPDGEELVRRGYFQDNGEIGEIVVVGSSVPEASLEVFPRLGFSDSQFTIDASNSFDKEDLRNLAYRFDFESDGIFETEFSKLNKIYRSFPTPGIKRILVEVKDSQGKIDTATTTIFIKDRDFPPKVELFVTVGQGLKEKNRGVVGLPFFFRAQGKDIEPQSNLKFRFDFEGDGNYDTPYSTSKTAKHVYLETGIYPARVEIMDNFGNLASTISKVEVILNTPPKAKFKSEIVNGTVATKFRFDGRESSDDQFLASTLEYRWDYNSDGIYDTKFSRSAFLEHSFKSAGVKQVTLQVRDLLGLTDTSYFKVDVLKNTNPKAFFTVTPKDGTYNTLFTFDASGSFDGQTDQKNLKFRWDFDFQGENDIAIDAQFGTAKKFSRRFNKRPGEFEIRLDVRDENGSLSSHFERIKIHAASPYIDFLRQKGVIRGYLNGEMRPEQEVTRAEFISMLMKSKKIPFKGQLKEQFSDVKKNAWFFRGVMIAKELDIVQGYADGTFKPHNSVTRGEGVTMVMKLFELREGHSESAKEFKDVAQSAFYYPALVKASKAGVVEPENDGTFKPNKAMTRGEAAAMIAKAMQRLR